MTEHFVIPERQLQTILSVNASHGPSIGEKLMATLAILEVARQLAAAQEKLSLLETKIPFDQYTLITTSLGDLDAILKFADVGPRTTSEPEPLPWSAMPTEPETAVQRAELVATLIKRWIDVGSISEEPYELADQVADLVIDAGWRPAPPARPGYAFCRGCDREIRLKMRGDGEPVFFRHYLNGHHGGKWDDRCVNSEEPVEDAYRLDSNSTYYRPSQRAAAAVESDDEPTS